MIVRVVKNRLTALITGRATYFDELASLYEEGTPRIELGYTLDTKDKEELFLNHLNEVIEEDIEIHGKLYLINYMIACIDREHY